MTVSDIFKLAVHGDRIVRIYGNCEVPPEINEEWYRDRALEYCANHRDEPAELIRDMEDQVIARRLVS
jgi:hypothetical protein